MKYTKEQRLDIGRRIYDGEISRYEAAEEYVINEQTARNYMRMYRDANQLPPKQGRRSICAPSFKKAPAELDELKAMTKEELIQELIKGIKAELFMDLHVTGEKPVKEEVDDYILFFNEQRPAYSLGYLTPKQYRERHTPIC